jgi:subfamily B ATP-binding cassette protein MsbA
MKAIFNIHIRDRHREILRMIKGHRFKFVASMVCSLIIAGTTAATAWLVEVVVDEMFTNKNLLMIKMIPVAIIFMYLIRGIGVFGQEYFMSYVGQHISPNVPKT